MARVEVALVHDPVVNRHGEVIGSAVTNLDLHDIARVCRTYGVARYWVVTPHEEQHRLVGELLDHWLTGYGSRANPLRGEALKLIGLASSLKEVVEDPQWWGCGRPLVLTTCASRRPPLVGYNEARAHLRGARPVLLVFGTAWGLAPEIFDYADGTLPPISGRGAYNHLSVRSAVAIILDRLLAPDRLQI